MIPAELIYVLIFLAIGAIAGWLAGQIIKGRGFGLVTNIIIGIIGSFIGGNFFGSIMSKGLVGSIVTATLGAVVLLAVVKLLKKI